jgi:uncharacterized protein
MAGANEGEAAILSGVPIAHGAAEHRVLHVATSDYRTARLEDADVPPMANGFLDGVNASLVGRGIDTQPAAGVFLTPVHERVPDVEAAIRLVDTIAEVYELDVDTAPLKSLKAEVQRHYRALGDRLAAVLERDCPDDRMFM